MENPIPEDSAGLRRRIGWHAEKQSQAPVGIHAGTDAMRLLHELEVHRIKLEMQNAELRASRDEVRAMLDKYTDLYDFAPVAYFTLAADGVIHLANAAASILVGIDRSKLRGRSFRMLVTAAQRPAFMAFLHQVFASGEKQSCDFVLVGGNQPSRVVSIAAQRAHDGLECNALVVDVTGRNLAENKMRVSEIRYRRLFEAAHDGVLLVDPETCRITDANPFMTQLLGYPRDQLVGKELYEIGLLKDAAASREMFRNLKRNHEVRYEDLPLESQGGCHQEVEVVANLYQEDGHSVIQCNIRDITARKHAEDLLRRNEALFSALVDQVPVGVYVVDARFRLQQANPMTEPVFRNVQPLIGRDFSEIMRAVWPRRVADQIISRFKNTLLTGEPFQSPRFSERRRDTHAREIYDWQIQRVTLPAGENGVVCFFKNITERVKAETAERRLEVLSASNLVLKQEITRRQVVEEDLRATRREQSLLLKQSRRQQQQLRDLSRRMLQVQEEERKRVSRELHDIIAQTLVGINVHLAALAKGAVTSPESLQQQIASTHLLVERSVDIVNEFARDLRPTILDDLGLIPALQTLMKRFMEETGIRVSLKASAMIEQTSGTVRTVLYRIAQEALANVARHAKASSVEVSVGFIAGMICMDIRDNGQGFDPEATSSNRKGGRLGLLGMRERVEMIGGVFRVDSRPGDPTTVHVGIPEGRGLAREPR